MLYRIKWFLVDLYEQTKRTFENFKDKLLNRMSEITFEDVIELVKKVREYKQTPLVAVLGLCSLMLGIMASMMHAEKKQMIIAKWYEQLPEIHWMKEDNWGEIWMQTSKMTAWEEHLFNVAKSGIGEEIGNFSKIMDGITDNLEEQHKSKFVLKYAGTEECINNIKIKQGEMVSVEFYYDDILQEFDITKEEAATIPDLLIVSCIEDTNVAVICDGVISAVNRGKTILYIYCNGFLFEYGIEVK